MGNQPGGRAGGGFYASRRFKVSYNDVSSVDLWLVFVHGVKIKRLALFLSVSLHFISFPPIM